MRKPKEGPKVLLLDIETCPVLGYVWALWDQNVSVNQIKTDWSILSWSAKWLGEKEIMYADQRHAKNIENDAKMLKGIYNLLDEADVVITQNGRQFDQKKLFARFVINGFMPPSSFKHIDTKLLAKKHFGFTSASLEYMSEKLCLKYKKLRHEKFAGFELWKQCLAGNKAAWREMEKYNKHDVLALEELYTKLVPWDSSVNFSLYTDAEDNVCKCGGEHFVKNGFFYTSVGKYQRYKCVECGAETRSRENLFSMGKRKSIRVGTIR